MFNSKVFVAELIGTFALTLIGAAAGVVGDASNSLGVSVLLSALASGCVLAVFVYIYGSISGSHLNPAVTFGMALNGTLKWGQAAFYWLAQLVGAIIAGFLLSYMLTSLGGNIQGGATLGVLTSPGAASTSSYIMAMIFEAILVFFLVSAYMQTTVDGKFVSPAAAWVIGMTLAFGILGGGAFSGGSLNPARTLGVLLPLALATEDYTMLASPFTYVVYLLGPLVGATLAIMATNFFQGGAAEDEDVEEVLIVESVVMDEDDEAVGK